MDMYNLGNFLQDVTAENLCKIMTLVNQDFPNIQVDCLNPTVTNTSGAITITFEAVSTTKIDQQTKKQISNLLKAELALRQPLYVFVHSTVIVGLTIRYGQQSTSVCVYFNI